jgi:hypothetical protein
MESKGKQWMIQIFCTKIGWLGICLISSVVFSILSNYYDWALVALKISVAYPVILTLIMMVYAWIINPIRSLKK